MVPFINHGFISVEIMVQSCALQFPALWVKLKFSTGGRTACPSARARRFLLLAALGRHLVRYNLPDAASLLASCLRCQVLKEK